MKGLIDTHCHLHDQEWFAPSQAEELLQAAHAEGVEQIIVIGTDPADSQSAQDFARRYERVFWTYGIHPENANRYQDFSTLILPLSEKTLAPRFSSAKADLKNVKTPEHKKSQSSISNVEPTALNSNSATSQPPSRQDKLVAIGEIGLDYHYEGYSRMAQIRLFEQMLQLAQDLNLPVSLHIREAFVDAWSVLDNFPKVTGVVHSFTGSKKDLKQALDRGFYLGVNGLATYTTPALPPLERMVLETDAPFLTPVPFRGTMNSPRYVAVVAAYLAAKLGVAEVNLAEQTTNNARKLFRI